MKIDEYQINEDRYCYLKKYIIRVRLFQISFTIEKLRTLEVGQLFYITFKNVIHTSSG